ncbi:hypothetical protein ACFOWT_02525 [Croceibacterium xixiisoli]|uniref:hypothetical protein n=1 Tax=Croceibacterium xixiisoli TaxID=1476466 RepID=UPI00360861A0
MVLHRMMDGLRGLLSGWNSLAHPLRNLPRWAVLLVLAVAAGSLAWSAITVTEFHAQQRVMQTKAAKSGYGDLRLYEDILKRVKAGENYYSAALDQQRKHNYPTSPFVTVRQPTLALGAAWFGLPGWRAIAIGVLFANILVWMGALGRRVTILEKVAMAMAIFIFGIVAFYARIGLIHEMIAGLFLSLALGLYRPRFGWVLSLIVLSAALAVREMVLPFLLLWAVFAVLERRWRELAGMGIVLVLFTIGMVLHAQEVMAYRLPGDLPSPGWNGALGPKLVLTSLTQLSFLLTLPPAWGGVLALLPILGWIGLGGRIGLFSTLWFLGMALAMSLFARPNNFYWVVLLLPAYLTGIVLVPRALYDLVLALLGRREVREPALEKAP